MTKKPLAFVMMPFDEELDDVYEHFIKPLLEDVGFDRVIEAGLGAGTQEYLAFQTHTFPAQRSARNRWRTQGHQPDEDTVADNPAYRALAEHGLDDCGITTVAGRTVGASFVGAVTATVVVAELLRMGLGGHRYEVVDGSLRSAGVAPGGGVW